MISDGEKEDFNSLIKERGFQRTNFKLIEAGTTDYSRSVYKITGTVTITHTSNSSSRTYTTGHGSSWLSQFELDLKSRSFD
jgi:hypothetical protein